MHRLSATLPAFGLACFGGVIAAGSAPRPSTSQPSTSQPSTSQPSGAGPYKVVKTVKVGGLGGFDYIFADVDGRRLYIPRGAVQGTTPIPARITVSDLDTLAPVAEIPDTRANALAAATQPDHAFATGKQV